jgi:hypothetical protein
MFAFSYGIGHSGHWRPEYTEFKCLAGQAIRARYLDLISRPRSEGQKNSRQMSRGKARHRWAFAPLHRSPHPELFRSSDSSLCPLACRKCRETAVAQVARPPALPPPVFDSKRQSRPSACLNSCRSSCCCFFLICPILSFVFFSIESEVLQWLASFVPGSHQAYV